jgi:ketosteroid isomerase-like protein
MRSKDFTSISTALKRAQGSLDPTQRSQVDSVDRLIDAIGRGDLDTVLANAAVDVCLDVYAPPEFSWIRHAVGADSIRAAIAHNFDSLAEQTPEVSNVLSQPDLVVLIGRERGIIRATGESYDVQFVQRYTFRGGKLAAVQVVAARS